jgi:hypothetical protein
MHHKAILQNQYVSGVEKKYLYAPSGEIIGHFKPGFLELV